MIDINDLETIIDNIGVTPEVEELIADNANDLMENIGDFDFEVQELIIENL